MHGGARVSLGGADGAPIGMKGGCHKCMGERWMGQHRSLSPHKRMACQKHAQMHLRTQSRAHPGVRTSTYPQEKTNIQTI